MNKNNLNDFKDLFGDSVPSTTQQGLEVTLEQLSVQGVQGLRIRGEYVKGENEEYAEDEYEKKELQTSYLDHEYDKNRRLHKKALENNDVEPVVEKEVEDGNN